MANFDYIEDIILKVDEGNIIKKKRSIIMPIVLLVAGAAILYFGTLVTSGSNSDMLTSLITIVGLGVIIWAVVAFITSKEQFIYKPSGKVLKKYRIYIAPNQSFKLHQMLDENKLNELKTIKQLEQSNLSLEIFCTDDAHYALLQALEFIPYNDVPITPVKIYRGEDAQKLSTLLA